jgi:GNAT superfamily N-acetyltransferase
MVALIQAHGEEHIGQVRKLFKEYSASLGVDLCFQNFDLELATLPGHYAPPMGSLLMAVEEGFAAGCAALTPIDKEICEMKRLYVRPKFRGRGVGKALVSAILSEAREIGYKKMRLDTLPEMKEAIALYQAFGFHPIPAYRFNPVPGALFMELNLQV